VVALSLRVAFVSLVCLGAGGALSVLTWWFWKTAMPEPLLENSNARTASARTLRNYE